MGCVSSHWVLEGAPVLQDAAVFAGSRDGLGWIVTQEGQYQISHGRETQTSQRRWTTPWALRLEVDLEKHSEEWSLQKQAQGSSPHQGAQNEGADTCERFHIRFLFAFFCPTLLNLHFHEEL